MNENKKILWIPDKSKPKPDRVSLELTRARKILIPGKIIPQEKPPEKNGNLKAPPDGLGS